MQHKKESPALAGNRANHLNANPNNTTTCICCTVIRWLASRYYPEMIWNQDMSREIDKLVEERDRNRERLCKNAGGGNDPAV